MAAEGKGLSLAFLVTLPLVSLQDSAGRYLLCAATVSARPFGALLDSLVLALFLRPNSTNMLLARHRVDPTAYLASGSSYD